MQACCHITVVCCKDYYHLVPSSTSRITSLQRKLPNSMWQTKYKKRLTSFFKPREPSSQKQCAWSNGIHCLHISCYPANNVPTENKPLEKIILSDPIRMRLAHTTWWCDSKRYQEWMKNQNDLNGAPCIWRPFQGPEACVLRRKSDGSGRCEGLLYRKKEGSAHQFLQAQS